MEHVALNNVQLDYLARDDPHLKPMFYGTVACDRLPKRPVKTMSQGYIVNTDPHDQPGQHWLAVWTEGNVCEVLDSYALPMDTYVQAAPFQDWIVQHWKYGDQWQVPPSHLKQELWRLRLVVLESQSPWTDLARLFK